MTTEPKRNQAKMLSVAIEIASKVFSKRLDKGGEPYILHCFRVMERLENPDNELKQIAMLHDVLEDSDYTEDDLKKLGFSTRVINAVRLMTHDDSDSYEDYISKMVGNTDAMKVKISDLRDNSDITRLKGISQKDLDRVAKYHRSYYYLRERLNNQ